VVGVIVQQTGSFVSALGFIGGVAAVGALSWIFVIGNLRRMHITVTSAAA